MKPVWQVEMREGSIYLPQKNLWCDARQAMDFCFVSHAHFDHLATHRRIITSEGTQSLMAARLPGEREELVLPFCQPYALDGQTEIELHPAGHILGSAMLRITSEGESLLYTGDFKLRSGRSAEECTPPRADVVIMETTFGLPRYVFPPSEKVLRDIVHFCRLTLDDGEVPVLFGYSLGKSQELLSSLADAGLPVMLHPQTVKMTEIYERLGVVFPAYRTFQATEVKGHVVICPPQTDQSAWLKKIKGHRTAAITGWATDPTAVYRYQCQAAFPLSDHADFADLLRFVELVQPRRVYTVHGYVEEFAQTLRERGFEAWALGVDNQLEMGLSLSPQKTVIAAISPGPPGKREKRPANDLMVFAETAENVGRTPKRLEKSTC